MQEMTKEEMIKEMIKLLDDAIQKTTFTDCDWERSSDQLRKLVSKHRYTNMSAKVLKAEIPEDILETLTPKIRKMLEENVDFEKNHIRERLTVFIPSYIEPTIDNFTQVLDNFPKFLVRAAYIRGSKRALQFLFKYLEENTLIRTHKVLLTGVTAHHPITLDNRIQITQIPKISAELDDYLPNDFTRRYPYPSDLLGRWILSMNEIDSDIRISCSQIRMKMKASDHEAHRFCEALSLAYNHYVGREFGWSDIVDIRAFNSGIYWYGLRSIDQEDPERLFDKYKDQEPLSREHLEKARNFYDKRRTKPNQGLDIAIRRWRRSKEFRMDLTDRFIDLRIALELLYLKGGKAKDRKTERRKHRNLGAWHLGSNLANDKNIQGTSKSTSCLKNRGGYNRKDIKAAREL